MAQEDNPDGVGREKSRVLKGGEYIYSVDDP